MSIWIKSYSPAVGRWQPVPSAATSGMFCNIYSCAVGLA